MDAGTPSHIPSDPRLSFDNLTSSEALSQDLGSEGTVSKVKSLFKGEVERAFQQLLKDAPTMDSAELKAKASALKSNCETFNRTVKSMQNPIARFFGFSGGKVSGDMMEALDLLEKGQLTDGLDKTDRRFGKGEGKLNLKNKLVRSAVEHLFNRELKSQGDNPDLYSSIAMGAHTAENAKRLQRLAANTERFSKVAKGGTKFAGIFPNKIAGSEYVQRIKSTGDAFERETKMRNRLPAVVDTLLERFNSAAGAKDLKTEGIFRHTGSKTEIADLTESLIADAGTSDGRLDESLATALKTADIHVVTCVLGRFLQGSGPQLEPRQIERAQDLVGDRNSPTPPSPEQFEEWLSTQDKSIQQVIGALGEILVLTESHSDSNRMPATNLAGFPGRAITNMLGVFPGHDARGGDGAPALTSEEALALMGPEIVTTACNTAFLLGMIGHARGKHAAKGFSKPLFSVLSEHIRVPIEKMKKKADATLASPPTAEEREQLSEAALAGLKRVPEAAELGEQRLRELDEGSLSRSVVENLLKNQISTLDLSTVEGGVTVKELKTLARLCPKLTSLTLPPGTTDAHLEAAAEFASLTELSLSGSGPHAITAEGLKELKYAPHLETLHLANCLGLSEQGLTVGRPDGRTLVERTGLKLDDKELTPEALTGLSLLMPKVGVITLPSGADDEMLTAVAGFKSLQALMLDGTDSNPITDTGLRELADLRALVEVSLANCPDITAEGLSHVTKKEFPNLFRRPGAPKKFGQLKNLIVDRCPRVDSGITTLAAPNLVSLTLLNMEQPGVPNQMSNMQRLRVSAASRITTDDIARFEGLRSISDTHEKAGEQVPKQVEIDYPDADPRVNIELLGLGAIKVPKVT